MKSRDLELAKFNKELLREPLKVSFTITDQLSADMDGNITAHELVRCVIV